jgi:hypothetical protein
VADQGLYAGVQNKRVRPLPVIRWLQAGAIAAGMGVALAASPAIASADDATASAASETAKPAALQSSSAGVRHTRAAANRGGFGRPAATAVPRESTGPVRAAGAAASARPAAGPARAVAAAPLRRAAGNVRVAAVTASVPSPVASAAVATPFPYVSATAPVASTASAAPTIGALPTLLRLTVEDFISGTGPIAVTNPTAVVTGLFNEVLRKAPTADELQSYLGVFGLTGVNGVVAGLYSSDLFRQTVVDNYYLELLNRHATQDEKYRGATQLLLGVPIPLFAASIAGSREFYSASSSLGNANGVPASSTTYVNLLYRAFLGQTADPVEAPIYVQQIDAGMPIGLTALQFVTSDAFRTVKLDEIYQVALGRVPTAPKVPLEPTDPGEPTADPVTDPVTYAEQLLAYEAYRDVYLPAYQAEVAAYPSEVQAYNQAFTDRVNNWFLNGGIAGIATSELATQANVTRIETGQVTLPDPTAVADLEMLLLTPFTGYPNTLSTETGFTKLLQRLLKTDPNDPTGPLCVTTCNTPLLDLIRTGGASRGIPNGALEITALPVNVNTMIPSQNEIDLNKSLKFPLTDPTTLAKYFQGGIITPPGGVGGSTSTSVLTSDGGKYIVDGHHRWSSIFVINPNAQVTAIDIGYVPDSQTALKQTQLAIAAANGTIPSAVATGPNLLTIGKTEFYADVEGYIIGTYDDGDATAKANEVAVGNTFAQNLGLTPTPGLDARSQLVAYLPSIQAYLWQNVQQMQAYNQPIVGAPPREVMPQAEPIQPILSYMNGKTLSYSFPIVSYLG